MRCYSAKDAPTAKWGTLLAVAFLIPIMIGVIWLGLTSLFLYPDLSDGGALTFFVLQEFPTGLKGLLLAGILAALMSSADICILTASASLTKDILLFMSPVKSPEVRPWLFGVAPLAIMHDSSSSGALSCVTRSSARESFHPHPG